MLRHFDLGSLNDLFGRHRRSAGTAVLRAAVEEFDPRILLTRSELERRFLDLCRELALASPEVNAHIEVDGVTLEVDFLWRAQGLVVETDGRRYHGSASAFEQDRRRDQRLIRAGLRVVRCTWSQVAGRDKELTQTLLDLTR